MAGTRVSNKKAVASTSKRKMDERDETPTTIQLWSVKLEVPGDPQEKQALRKVSRS